MKQITIDGNNFSDEEEFYAEIDRLLTKDLDWKTCHPSNASMVKDCISNAKDRTGKTLFDIIVDEILDSDDTGHRCKLTVKE